MKNVLTIFMCTLPILTGMAQTDLSGNQLETPEKILEQKSPSLNISSLATGVYVMNVKADGQTGTYKIIKK